MREYVLSLLFVCLVLTRAHADKLDDLVQAEMQKQHVPGVSVAVVKEGKIVVAKGYGMANVELGVPVTEKTVFEIGSMTKQFTATAMMMLVEENKVGLDEKITKYLDGLPDTWKEITVRQLLTHTSGIKGYTEVGDFLQLARNPHTQAEILKMVSGLPLDFPSGEKWAYSNTGYFLLGMIIEKVSSKPYGDFLVERIFKPLKMDITRDCDPSAVIPNRACGYQWTGKLVNAPALQASCAFSAGFLVSNVLDMAKWDAALYTDKLLKSSSLAQMWTPVKLKDGKPQSYGFGWAVGGQNNHRLIEHGGGTAAFSTLISRYPDDKLTVIVLTNRAGANAGTLTHKIAGLYVPALMPAEVVPIADKEPEVTQKLRALFVGLAEGKADEAQFTLEARKELFPDRIKEATPLLKRLGPLKSFTLVGRREENKLRIYHYRAEFMDLMLNVIFALTEDGKIASMGIRPG